MSLLTEVVSFIKKPFLRGFILVAGILLIIYLGFNIFSNYSTEFSNGKKKVAPIREDKVPLIKTGDQKSKEVIKIEVNRILDGANTWVQESIISNSREKGRLTIDFNKRGLLRSAEHIIAHIDRVNGYNESMDEYIKKINGEIKGLLLSAKEDKFETADWLKEEHGKYLKLIESAKTAKSNIKNQNNALCLRFSDEAAFGDILKEHPYRDGAD